MRLSKVITSMQQTGCIPAKRAALQPKLNVIYGITWKWNTTHPATLAPNACGYTRRAQLWCTISNSPKLVFELYFSDPETRIKELMGKTPDGLQLCNVCGKTERNSTNLRTHVESHHYSPGYKCERCYQVFKIRNSWRAHCKKKQCPPRNIFEPQLALLEGRAPPPKEKETVRIQFGMARIT